jgi:hypothetical protein
MEVLDPYLNYRCNLYFSYRYFLVRSCPMSRCSYSAMKMSSTGRENSCASLALREVSGSGRRSSPSRRGYIRSGWQLVGHRYRRCRCRCCWSRGCPAPWRDEVFKSPGMVSWRVAVCGMVC